MLPSRPAAPAFVVVGASSGTTEGTAEKEGVVQKNANAGADVVCPPNENPQQLTHFTEHGRMLGTIGGKVKTGDFYWKKSSRHPLDYGTLHYVDHLLCVQ